jgi:hypothetical protein
MGIDTSGILIVGCNIEHCRNPDTDETINDLFRSEYTGDWFHLPEGVEKSEVIKSFDLKGFTGMNYLAEGEVHSPVYIGVSVSSCRNRGESPVGNCTWGVIQEAKKKVEQSLKAKGFMGPIDVAFILEAG